MPLRLTNGQVTVTSVLSIAVGSMFASMASCEESQTHFPGYVLVGSIELADGIETPRHAGGAVTGIQRDMPRGLDDVADHLGA